MFKSESNVPKLKLNLLNGRKNMLNLNSLKGCNKSFFFSFLENGTLYM